MMTNPRPDRPDRLLFSVLVVASVVASTNAAAFSTYRARVPNGNAESCGTCHLNANIGGEGWNTFGEDVLRQDPEVAEADIESGNQNANYNLPSPTWDANLCGADSDGDGQSNGEELGDPACSWVFGDAAVPRTTDISHPGDAESVSANPTGTDDGGGGEGEGEGEGEPPPGCASAGASSGTAAAFLALLAMVRARRRVS